MMERGFDRVKKMWEKGANAGNQQCGKKDQILMLVTSIFICSHHSSLVFFLRVINHFPNKPWSILLCSTSILNTLWENEKLLIKSNFSFSHIVFFPLGELSAIFVKFRIVFCKLFVTDDHSFQHGCFPI